MKERVGLSMLKIKVNQGSLLSPLLVIIVIYLQNSGIELTYRIAILRIDLVQLAGNKGIITW